MALVSVRSTRPRQTRHILAERKLLLAVAAGGRCEFRGCNKYLFEHPISLSGVNLSKHAHIYAFSPEGPRGNDRGRPHDIHAIGNLILLCGDCHDEVDKNKHLYSADVLKEYRREHEDRIKYQTGLGPEARTSFVVLKARIGGRPVDVSFDEIRDAVAPRYPTDRIGYAIDLAELGDENAEGYHAAAARRITQRMDAFYERGIDGRAPMHVSAFGLAPIPLLMQFGRALSDKVELELFQRHHGAEKPWRWRADGLPARYERRLVREGRATGKVGLVLSLSGVVDPTSLPATFGEGDWLYEIHLVSENFPTVVSCARGRTCWNFAKCMRRSSATWWRSMQGSKSCISFQRFRPQ